MILSDNETKVDLLNNDAIAKTIVSLIKDSKEQPISIGIHGDWGAGKSSILEMVEHDLNTSANGSDKKYSCIRFNGWRHQGFEDSKIALISSIISELEKKEKLGKKAGEILKKLWKNINWMSVAKTAGKTALGIATGTAPITMLSSAIDILKSTVTTEEGISNAIESIGGYLKDAKITEDTSSNKEFTEFQKNFNELLEDASIEKLVVLIDDLDRCLPDVAIDTLEAVRLFMFTEKTAFVIAADEGMIRYSVKKHFPDATDENKFNTGDVFANKYLEKLIQVPFRIPALGEVEACIYIMLLMVGSVLSDENESYKKLREEGLSRIRKPWNVESLTVEDVKVILNDDYDKCSNEVLIATQICHLLAQNTDGNPRKIKRFVNMLLLRYEIAKNRGFGDELELAILAKMMLAEYYEREFYKELPNHLDSEGKWNEIPEILDAIEAMNGNKESVEAKEHWYDLNEICKWLIEKPEITDKDLRPYYYACKEKTDYFSSSGSKNDLSEIIDLLFREKMIIAGRVEDIKNMTGAARNSAAKLLNVAGAFASGGVRAVEQYLSIENLSHKTASDALIAITDFICPDGGSQDEGIARSAYLSAIEESPEMATVKFADLTSDQIMIIVERSMANAILNRITNDIGNKIILLPQERSTSDNLISQMKDFVIGSVADAVAELDIKVRSIRQGDSLKIVDQVYKAAFDIMVSAGENE